MIEQSVSLASNGVVKVPGYEQLVRFGYTKNRGVYRLHVDATGEWEADMRGAFGHDAGNGYNRGNSYANRGRHYVRGHYSRTDGRERMISDIEDMMQEATGAERDAYKRAADILRNA